MRRIGICLTVIVLGFLSAWIVGCETSSSPSFAPVTITPTTATIKVAVDTNEVEFTASGGDGWYVWSLDNPGLGSFYTIDNVAYYTHGMGVGVNRLSVSSDGQTAIATITQK